MKKLFIFYTFFFCKLAFPIECSNQQAVSLSCEVAADAYYSNICALEPRAVSHSARYNNIVEQLNDTHETNEYQPDKLPSNHPAYGCIENESQYVDRLNCIQKWKGTRFENLFSHLAETTEWEQALERVNDRFEFVSRQFYRSLITPWYFILAPNSPENIPQMRNIFDEIRVTVISRETRSRLTEDMRDFHRSGLQLESLKGGLNEINASLNIASREVNLVDLLFKGKSSVYYQAKVNPQFVLNATKQQTNFWIDYILAHEIAHVLTVQIGNGSTMGPAISDESSDDIQSRFQACLYADRDHKPEFREDLADFISYSIIDNIYPHLGPRSMEEIVRVMCGFGDIASDRGHSSGRQRFQNLVMQSKKMQNFLDCKEDRLVCKIGVDSLLD